MKAPPPPRPPSERRSLASAPVIHRIRALAVLAAAAAIALAGCGSEEKKQSTGSPTSASSGGSLADVSRRPVIPKPAGPPPTSLQVKDLVKGTGRAARRGDVLSMQYVGISYSNGREFDASWDRGEPFEFQLGAGSVIEGWDRGLVGIRPGGRRELVIPASLAYGAKGRPPAIAPNEPLVFVVDAVSVSGR
jgi:peptidylprolyl isomerase